MGRGAAGGARQKRGKTEGDAAGAHFGQRDRAQGPARLAAARLARANGVNGVQQIPVPLQGVPGKIEVTVNNQHMAAALPARGGFADGET